MPYKFVYFPLRGRGQSFRYLCTDNDIAFEDEAFPADEKQWAVRKPKTVLGQLPILFDGDLEIGQSNAILRHVARKHDLYGKDEKEKTLIDMLNDQQEDLRVAYLGVIYAPADYDAKKTEFIKGIPDKLTVFEKMLGKNHGGSGYFVGTKQSFVDYTIFDMLDNLIVLSPGCLDGTPLLKAFHCRIASKDKIAKLRQSEAFKKMFINANGKQ